MRKKDKRKKTRTNERKKKEKKKRVKMEHDGQTEVELKMSAKKKLEKNWEKINKKMKSEKMAKVEKCYIMDCYNKLKKIYK